MRRILAICGGGMKGMPAAAALDELRRMSGSPLSKSVDLWAGTSIGGILAGLASIDAPGSFTYFFSNHGPRIFQRRPWRLWPKYSGTSIEESLKVVFGGATLRDCRSKVLITALDRTNQAPFMFKSWETSNLVLSSATPLWQVGRATSAAQSYFPAFSMCGKMMWDGGNIANNPAVCAMAEARKLWPLEPVRVLVLGCGEDSVRTPWWLPQPVKDLLLTVGMQFDTSQDEVDYQMHQFIGGDYQVLQPEFERPARLDDASPSGIANLREASARFVREARPQLEWFLS